MLPRNFFLFALQLTLLVCVSAATARAKEWRGIIPLQSTRADVENLLGKPVHGENFYDTVDGRAHITYSTGRACEEGIPGLGNIPQDTVTEINIYLTYPLLSSSILVPGKPYTRIRAVHTPSIDYVDEQEGVRYTEEDGHVVAISYSGSAVDEKKFSCGETKFAAPVPKDANSLRIEQYPFDRYGKIAFDDAKARLDNFVIQLLQLNEKKPEYRAFIIVYAGKSAHPNEAQLTAKCAKDYLVRVREAPEESIVAVGGGHREEFAVELYIYPLNAYPPILVPTVSPRQVTTIKGEFEPCGTGDGGD